ncbi:hypothetical protein ACFQZE_16930 [Paenibacillus sp. GCM10027627]|uniref:hypothetical protein n=1 Tax=unclassified Paenibacillus TaxID=185978 RepID=UPI003644AC84
MRRDRKGSRQLFRRLFEISLLAIVLLAGCSAGGLRTETIVIADSETEPPAQSEGEPFEAEIYYKPMFTMNEKYVGPFRWSGENEMVRLSVGNKMVATVDRLTPPYEETKEILDLSSFLVDYSGLSPNGRYYAGFIMESNDNKLPIMIVDLKNGGRQNIENGEVSSYRMGTTTLSWSDNSRYLSYLYRDQSDKLSINVYDIEQQKLTGYKLADHYEQEFYYAIKLSEDGSSAVLIKEYGGEPAGFELGKLADGQFVSEYKHTLNPSLGVVWLDQDRIAFVGTDGTLFCYDRRNDSVYVLLDQVSGFALSADKQYIAYSTEEATIDVAKLQGNNLLHKSTVYHTFVASEMGWSPNNGSLFVLGRKPYEEMIAPEPEAKVKYSSEIFSRQLIVIDFK